MRRPRNKEEWIEAGLATVIIFLLVFLVIAPPARADVLAHASNASPDSTLSKGVHTRCFD